ncbi:MAG: beta-galactosidase [Bacteroidales bacterium]|nr:beta-galactosidase [Bacteroidales bacterium]MDT8373883.1 beta-galactosidase [Bacteroidales bacterium]
MTGNHKLSSIVFTLLILISHAAAGQTDRHTFALGGKEFLLDGKPFQIISGEMHPGRIPAEYWKHRIQMAKAMGCNTISAYLFWNHHEASEGIYDFHTGNRDISRFIATAAEEGMWVIIRPGPYVCAEWELGGIPPYLLRNPELKIRCMDSHYMKAAERYISRLADVLRPHLITSGGRVLMVQIENEYGSYGNDRNYMEALKVIWENSGIDVPFFTGDGPTTYMLEAGTLPGCAVGLDSGSSEKDFELARRMNPGVPVFSSETYPGWLTHWGEDWARPDTGALLREVKFLMDSRKSFNFYVIHGGTNFGFTAGANSGGKGYEPDLTSYDYDAPINEQGRATPKYMALRKLIGSYLPKRAKLPPIPDPVPAMSFPETELVPLTSIWDNMPAPIHSVQPRPFEMYGQDYGFMLYATRLIGHKGGKLTVIDLHDYATVFLDGKYIGTLDRRLGINSIDIPRGESRYPLLEIFVEGMGRINFAHSMIDRKGITDRVTLNGMTLMNWEVYGYPMDEDFISALQPAGAPGEKPGIFFRGSFDLETTADTFIDMTNFVKGFVWVNGHNLGRYWEIGPQTRLYCPAPWLKTGENEIIIFDLHKTTPGSIRGFPTM